MLFVVTRQDGAIKTAQFHRQNSETFIFETRQNCSDKASFNGIGLKKDEGT
jgi:hypothetical protein